MPIPFWIMALSGFAIVVGSPIALAIVLFLIPGRKGKMRTVREVTHASLSVEQAKTLYMERLERDGFVIGPTTDALQLTATRRRPAGSAVEAHSDKNICIEIAFTPHGRGVSARVSAWMEDFILFDTGEGRVLDLTLGRLLNESGGDDPPVVSTHSFMSMSSLAVAVVSIAAMVVLMKRNGSRDVKTAAVLGGMVLASLASIFLGREAMNQIRSRPQELHGRGTIIATVIVGAIGFAGGVVALWIRFGETLIEAFKQELL